ncbi:hypothetical protein LINPERHAP1_LOCUS24431, partial [Linum perenne]
NPPNLTTGELRSSSSSSQLAALQWVFSSSSQLAETEQHQSSINTNTWRTWEKELSSGSHLPYSPPVTFLR